jgi:hypothetical protein
MPLLAFWQPLYFYRLNKVGAVLTAHGTAWRKYDEHQELDVAEDRYRARVYQPPFDKLPWKGEGNGER